ncbi:hypothetical protein I3843_11G092300 [Carya illinoinensis]|uniref:Uncharacterized protein n=1 Tax=Carya illinoinensis TaxID=32201 RepID=A0A8T1P5M4_CARIL|nr:hypothetical protein CIPAW_11G093500 [Carya illinoinensis]KAG6636187.1 hypothetical protein CIPAW_11G093500 [Carya illinoinensis]KAG6687824.1 hypothetical protein I3842_11G092700 [Carya illinoinensis]KAG7955815.1 hypothetical protein I3843_11G092300 [Carya illinoinensis]
MNLNCLTCKYKESNTSESETEFDRSGECCCVKVDLFSTGNIHLFSYENMRSGFVKPGEKKVRLGHRRTCSEGVVGFGGGTEPRLVRSCGMRRDWSLEDLAHGGEKKGRKY